MNTTSRLVYAWARNGTLFKIFAKVNKPTGIPRPSLWLSFALAVFWTLPFPSWDALVNVCSVALILSYAIAPVSAAALNVNAKQLKKPLQIKGMAVIAPVSFIFASYIVYWSGWNTVSWLLGSQLVMFAVYCACKKYVPQDDVSFAQQLKSSWWIVGYYVMLLILSFLGSFGNGLGLLRTPVDLILIALGSIAVFYWAKYTALPKAVIDYDEKKEETV